MIPTRTEEVGSSIVSKYCPVLWTVEDGVVDREHGCNGEDLLTTLVSGQEKEVRRHHGVLEKDGR